MEIRPATAADVPAILPLVAKICALHEQWDPAKYGFVANPQERYRRWLSARADDPRGVLLVADTGEKIVGFLVGEIEQDVPIYRIGQFGFIHDLWIEPEYRDEGIGRTMVMLAIERFKQMGVAQVRLDTARPNDAARALFAACGFRVSCVEMLLELPASEGN